jgi:hypothetical protein
MMDVRVLVLNLDLSRVTGYELGGVVGRILIDVPRYPHVHLSNIFNFSFIYSIMSPDIIFFRRLVSTSPLTIT